MRSDGTYEPRQPPAGSSDVDAHEEFIDAALDAVLGK
jgi:hypothetical protein